MSFSDFKEPSLPQFKEWKIINIKDIVEIIKLPSELLVTQLPKLVDNFLQRYSDIHSNPTRFSRSECSHMPQFKSKKYRLNCITNICVNTWNKLTEMFESPFSL